MNRRNFLFQLSIGPAAAWLGWSRQTTLGFSKWQQLAGERSLAILEDDDETLCRTKFELSVSLALQKKPINEVIVAMGKSFLGTDYVAHALEVPGEERLVVNMRGLDCVSFYENALVLARCIKLNRTTFDDYRKQLQLIRYRGGVIDGYLSRLHYTTDYIYDNEKKGVWKDVTGEIGGVPYRNTVSFMSTHPENYRQLKENPSLVEKMKKLEEEISNRKKFYIPKNQVEALQSKILTGDILGITTDMEGLDTSHTGIAIRENGVLRFMHAPLAGARVQISERTLPEYLERNKRQTGIIVARPLEP